MDKVILGAAAAFGFLAVAAGAWGAHAGSGRLTGARLEVWQIALTYHRFHALALLGLALLAPRAGRVVRWAAAAMAVGIVLFSGSLYGEALLAVRDLSLVTPVGGTFLLLGWALLGVAAWSKERTAPE